MNVDIQHPDGPCDDCGSREFIRVWGLYDEHERAPGGDNTKLSTTRFKCAGCGCTQQVRPDPC